MNENKYKQTGILYTPIERSGHTSWNVAMRQNLDIYASLTLCKSMEGFPTRHQNVDFAIIRENTEGEYSGLEHQAVPGVVESLKIMTKAKSERIARFAFDFALKNGRKKVTCVHKVRFFPFSFLFPPFLFRSFVIIVVVGLLAILTRTLLLFCNS